MHNRLAIVAAALVTGAAAHAQTLSVSPDHKFSWGENVGFMNWADADGGADAVRFHTTFLSGFIWGENVGWINTGDGTPAGGTFYANADGTDFGVNIAPDGTLTGLAWGQNVGWINFSGGAMADPPQPARIDQAAARLRGYAWGENVGWINLDDANVYVGLACPCELDGDAAQVDVFDLLAYLSLWFDQDPGAERDGSAGIDVFDLLSFLSCWFQASSGAPCP